MLERLTSMDGSYVVEGFDEGDLPIRSNELPPPNFFERFLSTVDSDSDDDAEICTSLRKVRTEISLAQRYCDLEVSSSS